MSICICLFSIFKSFFVFIVLFFGFPNIYSPLYLVLVLSVLSFVSLCGHLSPVFGSSHSVIPTPYMDFLPVLCPSCSPLLPRYPSWSFYLNPSVSVMVASSSYPALCLYLPHCSYARFQPPLCIFCIWVYLFCVDPCLPGLFVDFPLYFNPVRTGFLVL